MSLEIRDLLLSAQWLGHMDEILRLCPGEAHTARKTPPHPQTHRQSRFFGAFEDTRLVAFREFLSHRILHRGEKRLMFQSCQGATHPSYHGCGLFSRIIDYAKTALAQEGDYLVGFPDDESQWITLNRLGFNRVDLTRFYAPCTPASFSTCLLDPDVYAAALVDQSMIKIDQYAMASWQQCQHPEEIVRHEYLTNFVWGRIVQRRLLGRTVRVLHAGGCELNKPWLLAETLRSLRRAVGVSLVRFECTKDSPLAQAWRWQIGRARTGPWIWCALRNTSDGVKFDAHAGAKDIY